MQYIYKAIKEDKEVSQKMEAENEEAVLKYLKENGFFPIKIAPVKKNSAAFLEKYFNKVSFNDVVDFTRQLAIMLNAGLTLVDALDILKRQIGKKSIEEMVSKIDEQIKGGASLGQRIVRKVCEFCREVYDPEESVKESIKATLGDLLPKNGELKLARGKGCNECNGTGYYGRVGIYEVLKISSAINKMILKQASGKEIEEQAKTEGLITMKQDGYLKALDHITTIEEVLRVAEV